MIKRIYFQLLSLEADNCFTQQEEEDRMQTISAYYTCSVDEMLLLKKSYCEDSGRPMWAYS